MKIIGSVREDHTFEKRISITPETVKKFLDCRAGRGAGGEPVSTGMPVREGGLPVMRREGVR